MTNSFRSSSVCFCLLLKFPYLGFLMERGMIGKGFVKELEDKEDFFQVEFWHGCEGG